MRKSFLVFILSIILSVNNPIAHAETNQDANRQMMRDILINVESAINNKNVEDITTYLHPQVTVVFQNAEVANGIPELRAFYERMLSGDSAILRDHKTRAAVSAPANIYGNTAVAHGTAIDTFSFVGGKDIEVTSTWSATLLKESGTWRVISLQFSANLFDNPLLATANASIKYFGIGGLLLGLILGYNHNKFLKKKKKN